MVVGIAVVATSVVPLEAVTRPRTIDREYQLLRDGLAQIPDGAEIYYAVPENGGTVVGGLRDPAFMSKVVGKNEQTWSTWPPEGPVSDRPRYYFHTSQCYVVTDESNHAPPDRLEALARLRRNCDEALAATRAHPVSAEEVPATTFAYESYSAETLPLGLYELPP